MTDTRPGAPPRGYSHASKLALDAFLERTQGSTRASANMPSGTHERSNQPHDDESEVRNGDLRSSNLDASPPMRRRSAEHAPPSHTYRSRSVGGGNYRDTGEAESRTTDYSSASDMSGWDSGEDWPDNLTLADEDMADGTSVDTRARDPFHSGYRVGRSTPTLGIQPAVAFAERSMALHSQYSGRTSAGTSTRPNAVHGHSAGTSGWRPGSQYITRESTKICVICKTKPIYMTPSGSTPYSTCGLTCGAILDQRKQTRTTNRASSPKKWLSKCVVCKVKDQYYNRATGKKFPTCGNACAAVLRSRSSGAPAKGVGVCEQCRKKPKALSKTTGRPYDFCSPQCRDKRSTLLGKAIAGTCQICLVCLRGTARDGDQPCCSPECVAAAGSVAPTMVEVPKGHVMFEKYNRRFQQGYDASSDSQPVINHMYFFAQTSGVRARYTSYKDELGESQRGGRGVVEKELWITLIRECNTGNSGEVDPCSSPSCTFCSVVRNGFRRSMFSGGVCLSSAPMSPKASPWAAGLTHRTRAAVFVRLVHEAKRMKEFTAQQVTNHALEMRKESSAVKIVVQKGHSRAETGEVHVFELAAILALGCIVYA